MEKLTFSYQRAPTFIHHEKKVDLASASDTINIQGKDGKTKTITGFQADNGSFFRLKQRAEGGFNVIAYGTEKSLASYNFAVKNGDLTKARFDGERFKKADFAPRELSVKGDSLADPKGFASAHGLKPVDAAGTQTAGFHAQPRQGVAQFGGVSPPKLPKSEVPKSGLKNFGNTCYLNASLKLLLATRGQGFVDHLRALGAHPEYLPTDAQVPSPFERLRQALLSLSEHALEGQSTAGDLDQLANALEHPDFIAMAQSFEAERQRLTQQRDAPGANRQALDQDAIAAGYTSVDDQLAALESLSQVGRFAEAKARWTDLERAGMIPDLSPGDRALARAGLLNSQQDATDFIAWLRGVLRVEISAGERVQARRVETNAQGIKKDFPSNPPGALLPLKVEPGMQSAGLPALIRRQFATAEQVDRGGDIGQVTHQNELVADLSQLKQLTLSIDSAAGQWQQRMPLSNIDFNAPITVPIVDSQSGQTVEVALRPREVVFHQGGDGAGHYFAVSRQVDGRWTLHDDERVLPDQSRLPLSDGTQPRLIVFELVPPQSA